MNRNRTWDLDESRVDSRLKGSSHLSVTIKDKKGLGVRFRGNTSVRVREVDHNSTTLTEICGRR